MKDFTKNVRLCVVGALVAGQAYAVEPVLKTQVPQDGGTYTLLNLAQPNQYWTRTSWDGAYYLLPWSEVGLTGTEAASLTAVKNTDDTWSFIRTEGEGDDALEYYLDFPANSGNVNTKFSIPAKWKLEEGDQEGYYKMQLVETANNDEVLNMYLHLNNGCQYAVITFDGDGWFPDCYGGIEEVDDDWTGNVSNSGLYKLDENGHPYYKNSISFNWAFVAPEDIETYANQMNASDYINSFEADYAEDAVYGEGATKVLASANALYEAGNPVDAVALITTARNLISAIEEADAINEDGSLDDAIATAIAAIGGSDMEGALATFTDAVTDYKLGKGDITSKGVNMSFEDLSNQGGAQSTGVTNAPYGWNLYLNGALCNEASQIKAAGVANWCSINDDCEGETKDGSYGFGIWTSSMPKVELSQSITGLQIGTYSVTAAVMVGANGNGSRMTTQRIFANTNATYFGSEEQYNLEQLDASEIYGFQGLEEPVTDRILQDVTVKAFVADGTLTFGFRTDGNYAAVAGRTYANGAGGDGWFKVDNFRLEYEGLDLNDAKDILSSYSDKLSALLDETMSLSAEATVNAALDAYSAVDDSDDAAVIALISQMKSAYDEGAASVAAYAAYQQSVLSIANDVDELRTDPSYDESAIAAFDDVLAEAYDAYDNGDKSDEELNALVEQLTAAYKAILEGVLIEVDSDITKVIVNPSFEVEPGGTGGVAAAPKGWTLSLNGVECATAADAQAQGVTGWCDANTGDGINVEDENGEIHTIQPTDGDYLWGIWNSDMPEVELSQTLKLPVGTYVLTADVMVQYNWAGNCVTTQRIFANSYVQMFGEEGYYETNMPKDALAAQALDAQTPDADVKFLTYAGYNSTEDTGTTALLKTLSVTFGVSEADENVAKIGFRTSGDVPEGVEAGSGRGWFKVDNFTLYYVNKNVPTAVEGVTADKLTKVESVEYYTADGRRVAAPTKGVTVVKARLADGSVRSSKISVK